MGQPSRNNDLRKAWHLGFLGSSFSAVDYIIKRAKYDPIESEAPTKEKRFVFSFGETFIQAHGISSRSQASNFPAVTDKCAEMELLEFGSICFTQLLQIVM